MGAPDRAIEITRRSRNLFVVKTGDLHSAAFNLDGKKLASSRRELAAEEMIFTLEEGDTVILRPA